jgi:hypothetical protein
MYIRGNRSFVNLDTAEHVELVGARGGNALKFTTDRNRELGITEEIDLEHATAPLVPSSAVVIAIDPMGRTTAHPVAAYRVLRGGVAEPVFTVAVPEDAALFQAVGGQGFVHLDTGELYRGVDQARTAVLEMAPPAPANPEPEPAQSRGKRYGTR